jgi:hypothetical protein
MQPRNADPVALFDATHAWPKGSHVTDTFVARNKGRFWFHWPVSLGGMQIGVADAGRLDAHEDFASPWFRNWHLLEHKRFLEHTQLGVIERTGRLLPVAGDEGYGRSAIEQ